MDPVFGLCPAQFFSSFQHNLPVLTQFCHMQKNSFLIEFYLQKYFRVSFYCAFAFKSFISVKVIFFIFTSFPPFTPALVRFFKDSLCIDGFFQALISAMRQ